MATKYRKRRSVKRTPSTFYCVEKTSKKTGRGARVLSATGKRVKTCFRSKSAAEALAAAERKRASSAWRVSIRTRSR